MPREAEPALIRTILFVRALQVEARIGAYAHERAASQQLIVDLEIEIEMPRHDNIEATLDYVSVAEVVRRRAGSREFQLIETFAREIGVELLGHDRVRELLVRITKPSALAESANATGVEIILKPDERRESAVAH